LTKRVFRSFAVAVVAALALSGCSGEANPKEQPITIGVVSNFTTFDPAGSWAIPDQEIMHQVYSPLFNTRPSDPKLRPDLAFVSTFESEYVFLVSLKEDLTFANGNELTSSDVVYSFNRVRAINSPNGPVSLLSNIESVTARNDLIVEYRLKVPFDRTIKNVLSSVASLIVDEEVFPADEILSNEEIVAAQPFNGQYVIDSFKQNEYVSFSKNPEYGGVLKRAKNNGLLIKYFTDSSNLLLEAQTGALDVALGWRSLDAAAVENLTQQGMLLQSPVGVEANYLVFDHRIMPFGTETPEPDSGKALAVRQAIAHLIDREQLAKEAHFNTATPAYSIVPSSVVGSFDAMTGLYGNYRGGPNLSSAIEVLQQAGITEPVQIELTFSPERFGPAVNQQMILLADQLNQSGLFEAKVVAMEWSALREARNNGQLAFWMAVWGPDFVEADNYLSPFFRTDTRFFDNGWGSDAVDKLLIEQLSEKNPDRRGELLAEVQIQAAADLPLLPMLETGKFAVIKPEILGFEEILDTSYKLRLGHLTR
jgi:peptide/nickel transport system substrate-binding protein